MAFTTETVPRLLYQYKYSADGSLDGYTKFVLSVYEGNRSFEAEWDDRQQNESTCFYSDFREPPTSSEPFGRTRVYWEILAMRLLLFCLFDHLVYTVTEALAHWIPDVPSRVSNRAHRAAFLRNQLILRAEHDRARTSGFFARRLMGGLSQASRVLSAEHGDDLQLQGRERQPVVSFAKQVKMQEIAKQAAEKRSTLRDKEGANKDPNAAAHEEIQLNPFGNESEPSGIQATSDAPHEGSIGFQMPAPGFTVGFSQ